MKKNINLKLRAKNFLDKFDILLLLASLPLIPMLVAEFFVGIDAVTQAYFDMYYLSLWFVFSVEFFAKLHIAKDKLKYIKENWLDALVVIAPVFRSIRLFRVIRTPVLLVSDEAVKFFKSLRLNFVYFFIITFVVILIAADFILFFERGYPNSNINTFGDAVWWGFVTFSTLGYGDFFPVSFGGRVVSIFLMTLGFALFSILAANAVSFFMKKKRAGHISAKSIDLSEEIMEEKLNKILERLDKIEKRL